MPVTQAPSSSQGPVFPVVPSFTPDLRGLPPLDGCIDPCVLTLRASSDDARPAGRRFAIQLPNVPAPSSLGVPPHAFAAPPALPYVFAPIRSAPQCHQGFGAPALFKAVQQRADWVLLAALLKQGERVGMRVHVPSSAFPLDAIDLAFLTNQGHVALYLCAYELSRLGHMPDGQNAAGILTRTAKATNALLFAKVVTSFSGFMQSNYQYTAPQSDIQADVRAFVRAACGYALLTSLAPHQTNTRERMEQLIRAQRIAQLGGFTKVLNFASQVQQCHRELVKQRLDAESLSVMEGQVRAVLDTQSGIAASAALFEML